MPVKMLALLVSLILLSGCDRWPQAWKPFGSTEHKAYKLYRSSMVGSDMKIHIATFDADEGIVIGSNKLYNLHNCEVTRDLFEKNKTEVTRDLFQNEPGVEVKFWCE